ncbi:hypothetical protein OIU34_06210 [Pararhizobium sp. BT-229]|uniref:hypothetical protein n=1 Tax=Pararhizobium sp. BT-229 TaxID=2986923 RepID=UPI0021F78C03|nr:hypothetical protein [Pararhizobium sp. BT-229]MCV9961490.1 hypothetical protein [Pararhizobium sp. BT-229]
MTSQFRSDLGLVATCALTGVAGAAVLCVVGLAWTAWNQVEKLAFTSTLSSISNALFYGFMILPSGVIYLLPYAFLLKWVRRRWGVTNWITHVALGTGYFTFLLLLLGLLLGKDSASPELTTQYLNLAGISVSAGALFGTLFWLTACWSSRRPTGEA